MNNESLVLNRSGSRPRADWLVPTGLILLSLVPMVAGMARLVGLSSGGPVTPENSRFYAAPVPVVLHILGATLYSILGAFQFSSNLRRKHPGWHRMAGRVLLVAGLVTAVSGLWMTMFYPLPAHLQGPLLWGVRLVVGSVMVFALVRGWQAIVNREVAVHRAWMTRAYALGAGAGTQVFTAGISLLVFGVPDLLTYELQIVAGWVINVAVAEWVIRGATRHQKKW